MRVGIEQEVTAVLDAMNEAGGYRRALVCTEDGLLIAAAGEGAELEAQNLAAFTSLFDTIVERARRDLGSSGVDEVTLLDADAQRLVIRPLPLARTPRMFLVLWVARNASWRKNTNVACAQLAPLLEPLTTGASDEHVIADA